jgi:hypothetical protein
LERKVKGKTTRSRRAPNYPSHGGLKIQIELERPSIAEFLQNRQSQSFGRILPFRRPGNECETISANVPRASHARFLDGQRLRWPRWRGGESAACKNRKGLRDTVLVFDLEPLRTSSKVNVFELREN